MLNKPCMCTGWIWHIVAILGTKWLKWNSVFSFDNQRATARFHSSEIICKFSLFQPWSAAAILASFPNFTFKHKLENSQVKLSLVCSGNLGHVGYMFLVSACQPCIFNFLIVFVKHMLPEVFVLFNRKTTIFSGKSRKWHGYAMQTWFCIFIQLIEEMKITCESSQLSALLWLINMHFHQLQSIFCISTASVLKAIRSRPRRNLWY